MANIITQSVLTRDTQQLDLAENPFSPVIESLPKSYCKVCERFYSDHPELVQPEDYGMADVPNGQVAVTERLLECRTVAGVTIHRFRIGNMMHHEAIKAGY